MAKKKVFCIPDQVLRQVDEVTNGGFLLFTFDQNGIPQTHASFDSMTHSLAMQHFVETWITTVKDLNIEAFRNTLISNTGEPEED